MSHKYNAVPTICDGVRFDSRAESFRFRELKLLEIQGEIKDLKAHPKFELQPAFVDRAGKKQQAIVYEADFSYFDRAVGHTVIEEVKGVETQAWRIKKRLFLYKYPEYELRVIK